MGLYNTLKANLTCSKCNKKSEFEIQFKYGNVRLFEYKIGDMLLWGRKNTGIRTTKKVVLDGVSTPCKYCGVDNEFLIYVYCNKIASVETNNGQYDFLKNNEYYIVLDE